MITTTTFKSLVKDQQSAMVLAQKNSTAEQKHQSDQYNKRVKGLPLSVGDHVLVANKGCRGKRKLANKWKPTLYSIVSSNPSLHIYKIRDRSGREKVVHRNLLLPVNFLPLPTSEFDFAVNESVCNGPSSTPSQSVCDLTDSTMPVTDDLSHAESLSVISHVAGCDDDPVAAWVSSHSTQTVPEAHDDVSVVDFDTVASASSPTVPVSSNSNDPVVRGDSSNHYTTRFGRVIRPVIKKLD